LIYINLEIGAETDLCIIIVNNTTFINYAV
jgi:hypothetical protein